MGLDGAAADLDQLGVAEELLDAELGAVAPAAEDLDRGVGDLLGGGGGEQLGGVGADPVAVVGAGGGRDRVDQGADGLDLGVALAQVALDLAVLVQRLAERLALGAVAQHDVEAALRDAEAHRGQAEPLDLEVAHHVGEAVALGAEQVGGRDPAVVEDQLRHRRRPHAHLRDLVAGGEAGRAALDEEGGDPAVELGVDHEQRGLGAVGDEGLAAVEDVAVRVLAGDGGHAEDVGAVAGLAHAHRADRGAAQRPGQVAGALGRRRRPVEVVDEQQRVREVGQREAGVGVGDLLVDDDRGGGVEAGAAVGVGDGDAEQPELAGLTEQPDVEGAELIVLHRLLLDVAAGPGADRLAQHRVLLGRVQKARGQRGHACFLPRLVARTTLRSPRFRTSPRSRPFPGAIRGKAA